MINIKLKIDFKIEANTSDNNPKDDNLIDLNTKMRKRMQIAIKLLLKENPVLPTGFRFNGEDLFEKLKREEREYINAAYKSLGLNEKSITEYRKTNSIPLSLKYDSKII